MPKVEGCRGGRVPRAEGGGIRELCFRQLPDRGHFIRLIASLAIQIPHSRHSSWSQSRPGALLQCHPLRGRAMFFPTCSHRCRKPLRINPTRNSENNHLIIKVRPQDPQAYLGATAQHFSPLQRKQKPKLAPQGRNGLKSLKSNHFTFIAPAAESHLRMLLMRHGFSWRGRVAAIRG